MRFQFLYRIERVKIYLKKYTFRNGTENSKFLSQKVYTISFEICQKTELSNVRGLNSVGGFVGYSGKSGVVKADKIDVIGDNTGQLLGGALGVMDIFGSHIDDCAVSTWRENTL